MPVKYLKIETQRIKPNRKVLFDFFVFLPRNNKHIRIIPAGDIIDTEQCSRIARFPHLYISYGDESVSPLDLQIQEEPTSEILVVNAVEENDTPVSNVMPLSLESANLTQTSVETEIIIEEDVVKPKVSENINTEISSSSEKNELVENIFSPSQQTAEPEQIFSADNTQNDLEQKFSADRPVAEQELSFSADDPQKLEEMRFSSSPREANSIQTIRGGSFEKDQDEIIIKAGPPKKETQPLKLVSKFKELADLSNDEAPNLASSKVEELVNDMTIALTISKIAREISSLVQEAEKLPYIKREKIRVEIDSLLKLMNELETTPPLDEALVKFSVAQEMTEIESAIRKSPNIAALSKLLGPRIEKANLSKAEAENMANDLAHSMRGINDMPATASRLAVQLGQYTGYNNIEFLSDLAISASTHFSTDADFKSSLQKKDPFFDAVLSEDEKFDSNLVLDAREIIEMIDFYFQDPSCDRGNKDFDSQVFLTSAQSLLAKNKDFNIWNLTKWRQSIERAPSMDLHSVCTKACSLATKKIRELS